MSPDRGTAGLKRQPYTEQEVNAAIEALAAERDAARALLAEARDLIVTMRDGSYRLPLPYGDVREKLDRIDALLTKTEGTT